MLRAGPRAATVRSNAVRRRLRINATVPHPRPTFVTNRLPRASGLRREPHGCHVNPFSLVVWALGIALPDGKRIFPKDFQAKADSPSRPPAISPEILTIAEDAKCLA